MIHYRSKSPVSSTSEVAWPGKRYDMPYLNFGHTHGVAIAERTTPISPKCGMANSVSDATDMQEGI